VGVHPGSEVLEDRRRLCAAVDRALDRLASGSPADLAERENVDFKEEAGRRGRGGEILPGDARSQAVAAQLADEVACLANTPGGGALIVGVADDGSVIGAASERDWLRQRIHERVDVAPAVEERWLPNGARLLVILVAEAPGPVETTAGTLRWRVGVRCAPVDRSEWWAERVRRAGADPFSATTRHTPADLSPDALAAVRRLLRTVGAAGTDLRELNDRELLTRLGVLLPDGHLTAAGAHLLCPAPRTVLELIALDVAGGDIISSAPDLRDLSLAEQLVEVETRLDVLDSAVVIHSGLRLEPVRQIPWLAVREAVLNAIVHRDWMQAEPIHITWVQADASLDVVSPGGFAGGVTAASVLSARYSRNPALADLARALGLVERQGIGVDRMYRELVALGHRPPLIREEAGPRVRTRLVGGAPLTAVMAVMVGIDPPARRRDVRVALAMHVLMRDGFVVPGTLSPLLQVPLEEAEEALDAAANCTVDAAPLIRQTGSGIWLPGAGVVSRATADRASLAAAQRRGLLGWHRPSPDGVRRLVESWLAVSGRITTSDVADVTTFTNQRSLQVLNRLVDEGVIERGGASRGRLAHFVRRSA
jgi:ATP-dependent DNA helicase RecG